MILDTNTWLGRWHNQKFLTETVEELQKHLQSSGLSGAVISSTDAVFCSDPQPWNEQLSRSLSGRQDFFTHAPVIKPTLANRNDILAHYSSLPRRIIRLLPGYHDYSLTSAELRHFFGMCSQRAFTVMIQIRMEDERAHHKLVRVPPVDTEEIIELAGNFPRISFLCLSAYFRQAVTLCSERPNIYVDISFVEKMNTVAALTEKIPASQVVFGSHSPFFCTESALLKMRHAEICPAAKKLIQYKNAAHLSCLEP